MYASLKGSIHFEDLECASVSKLRKVVCTSRTRELERIYQCQSAFIRNPGTITTKEIATTAGTCEDDGVGGQIVESMRALSMKFESRRQLGLAIAGIEELLVFSHRTRSDDLTLSLCSDLFKKMEQLHNRLGSGVMIIRFHEKHARYISDCIDLLRSEVSCAIESSWHTKIFFPTAHHLVIDTPSQLVVSFRLLGLIRINSRILDQLSSRISEEFLRPILIQGRGLAVDSKAVRLDDSGSHGLLAVYECVLFLRKRMPSEAAEFFDYLCPHLLAILRDFVDHQNFSDMTSLDLEDCITQVIEFQQNLVSIGAIKCKLFQDVIEHIPTIWRSCRRNSILQECRKKILKWAGEVIVVEDDEKELGFINRRNSLELMSFANDDGHGSEDDDWNATAWDVSNNDDDDELGSGSKWYCVSTIPGGLLNLMEHCRNLASTQDTHSSFSDNEDLESIIINCYKTLVLSVIQTIGYPRMTIYNDCIFLASKSVASGTLRAFGESFYVAEIREKRDQILSIFARTGDFISCTLPAQNKNCYSVIQEVLDLFYRLRERYDGQLAETTKFTALGTLAEFSLSAMISAIMGMTDISEAESFELARMGELLAAVEQVFTRPDGVPLIAKWCPSWIRFRLLLEVLEANLDDLQDLWYNGKLKVTFKNEELRNLILALFSDSTKRHETLQAIL